FPLSRALVVGVPPWTTPPCSDHTHQRNDRPEPTPAAEPRQVPAARLALRPGEDDGLRALPARRAGCTGDRGRPGGRGGSGARAPSRSRGGSLPPRGARVLQPPRRDLDGGRG